MIWDIAPIVLYISVQDAAGNDLLNPETPGNIANQGIKAIYKDKTYEKDIPVAQTKAYLAILYGLQTIKDKSGRYYLAFGEFDGAKTFEDESVTIDWNDGSTDVITFSSKLTWVAKKPVTNRKFCLNGVDNPETNRSSFLITKQPALQAGSSFLVKDVRYGIVADNASEIEADLQQNLPYPAGSSFAFAAKDKIIAPGGKATFTWKKADGSVLKSGELLYAMGTSISKNIPEEATSVIKLVPPDNQIYTYLQWDMTFADEAPTYHLLLVRSSSTRSFFPNTDLWLYEDLTAHYQSLYPGQHVQGVTRALKCDYITKKQE